MFQSRGGTPEVLTALDIEKGEASHRWPEMLPGGKAVLYTVTVSEGGFNIAVLPLENGEPRILVRGGSHAHYVPTGHLAYARPPSGEGQVGRRGGLLAVPFDLARLRVTGPPVAILEGVEVWFGGATHFSFSDDGSLVYAPSGSRADRRLVWVDRQGKAEPLSEDRRFFMSANVSPDGERLAVSIRGGGSNQNDVWIYEMARRSLTRFTFQQAYNWYPVWTPDGKRMAFQSYYELEGRTDLLWKSADGSGEAELLLGGGSNLVPYSWSPDGRLLAFSRSSPTTRSDIWLLPVEGDRKPQPFLQTPFSEYGPMFSPDGRWIAYVSDESGQREVYVRPYPGPGGKVQVSTEGGNQPRWAPNSRELFYRRGNKMMAVALTTKPSFTAGTPKELFEIAGGVGYDVAPDGRRFLFIKEGEDQPAANQLNVVLNWFDELRRRVPTDGN